LCGQDFNCISIKYKSKALPLQQPENEIGRQRKRRHKESKKEIQQRKKEKQKEKNKQNQRTEDRGKKKQGFYEGQEDTNLLYTFLYLLPIRIVNV
jgi:hypothetical protein